MSFEDTYYSFLFLWAFVALIVFIVLFYKDAPYGRHLKQGSSFTLPHVLDGSLWSHLRSSAF
jgi:hypothetical protein